MLFVGVFFLVLLFSVQRRKDIDLDYLNRDKTMAMRGIMACAIVLTHMVSESYKDMTAGWIINSVIPSLVCMFLFYSGYGLFVSLDAKGEKYLQYFWGNTIRKLVIPALLCVIMNVTIKILFENILIEREAIINEMLSIGGWYLRVTLLLYGFFWISAYCCSNRSCQLRLLIFMVLAYMIICKIFGISFTYYVEAPVFLLGVCWYVYKERIRLLFASKFFPVSLIFSCTVSIFAGQIPYLLSCGVLSNGRGIGLIGGTLGAICFCYVCLNFLRHFDFRNRIFSSFGSVAYEMYLLGEMAKTISENFARSAYEYYFMYILVSAGGAFLLQRILKLVRLL